MRDYADYFIDRKITEKRGVCVHRNIDWWLEYVTEHMAKLLFVILLAVIALVLKSFWQMGKSQRFFPIENISMTGDVLITQPQDINQALAELDAESFFSINLAALSEKLTERPWIESATVTRQWPDRLAIKINERKAAYRWGENQLMDEKGSKFANADQQLFSILPKLSGIEGFESETIKSYHFLIDSLGVSAQRLAIEQFTLNKYLSWELHLKSGAVIVFGRNHFKQRAQRFADAFQAGKTPDLDKVNTLDFRYNRGFAAKWKPEFLPKKNHKHLVRVATGI